MGSSPMTNNVQKLYAMGDNPAGAQEGLAGPVLGHLTDAWQALEYLEANLPEEPDRWQADGLFTAREGVRHAWLALSNLDRRLSR